MALTLTSLAFGDGQAVPAEFTCDGDNLSPPLAWAGPPEGTRSFALVMDDPDAPGGTFTHWLLYDVPAAQRGLDQGAATGAPGKTLHNDFGKPGYGGPCPPRRHGVHRYRFTLHALDVPALRFHGHRREDLDRALGEHTLATATLTGRYERT